MELAQKKVWKKVEGYDGYEVSNHGDVKSYKYKEPKLLNLMKNHLGYYFVCLKKKRIRVHRLVLKAFGGPSMENRIEVRHLDGNPSNNHIDNLKWGSRQENELDKVLHGTILRGSKHGSSKIKESDVVSMRKEFTEGSHTYAQLGIKYGLAKGSIKNIVKGRRWKHVLL